MPSDQVDQQDIKPSVKQPAGSTYQPGQIVAGKFEI